MSEMEGQKLAVHHVGDTIIAGVNNFLSKKMFAYEIKLLYLHKISER